MSEPSAAWSEADSREFINLADIAVPGREEQLELILSLIPAQEHEEFRAVELACGEGILAERLLERFPNAQLVAFDGSEMMIDAAQRRLSRFGSRVRVQQFELATEDWSGGLETPLRCVLSSLAIHHLSDEEKASLYARIAEYLEPGGALLIADAVLPANATVRSSVVSAWHRIAKEQSEAQTGSPELYQRAVDDGWAPPDTDEAIPGEMPASLYDHLAWLTRAGFQQVDCFWMRAGIAIYGGYRGCPR
jgi:ubiquinone/menaquinone biosynthesis C-methylase UbiE